jgi:hypothetical protein
MHSRRLHKHRASLLTALFTTLGVAATAGAGNWGSVGTTGDNWQNVGINIVVKTNNDWFNLGKRFLTTTANASADAVANDIEGSTGFDAWAGEIGDCYSSEAISGFDVCLMDADYGNNGVLGWVQCPTNVASGSHPNMQCDLPLARLNEFFSGATGQYNTCHEIGHTVALQHTSDSSSCLKTASSGGSSATYSSHDRGHLLIEY